jgi:hypothetical protein
VLLGLDAAEVVLLRLHVRLVVEERRMARVGNEIGEVRTVGQVAGGRCRGVEHDDHRARLQLLLDAGCNFADVSIRHGQYDDVGTVQRLIGGDSVEAETVLETFTAGLANLHMTDLVRRAAEVRGQAIPHLTASAEKGDFRHTEISSYDPVKLELV